jgi:hypothetical protein
MESELVPKHLLTFNTVTQNERIKGILPQAHSPREDAPGS